MGVVVNGFEWHFRNVKHKSLIVVCAVLLCGLEVWECLAGGNPQQ